MPLRNSSRTRGRWYKAHRGRVGGTRKRSNQALRNEDTSRYEDASGKDAKEDPSGDYLIWRELLDPAASKPGPILFVTDDKKADWYEDKQKRILGPRVELRIEMSAVSTDPYHQTPLNSFLHLVEKCLGLTLSKDTVNQVKEQVIDAFFCPGPTPSRRRPLRLLPTRC